MEVKVQCGCGVRYAFDVEPVNGQLPMPIACPKCGADGTAFANMVIAEKLAALQQQQPPQLQTQATHSPQGQMTSMAAPRGTSLRVSTPKPATLAPTAHAPTGHAAPAETGAPVATFCSRHPRNPSS